MISYEEIKTWLQDKDNKQKLVYGACFVLVFIMGFGAGRFDGQNQKNIKQVNYTTKPAAVQTAGQGTAAAQPEVKGTSTPASCLIKGNSASLIYHVPGGYYYAKLKNPRCFGSEAEAKAAGYRKSSR